MNCLLDTCTFLWLTDRVGELSAATRAVLEDPGNELLLSQVSILEIQLKFNKGKLPSLHHDPLDRLLIAQAIHEGLALVTPDPRIAAYPVRTVW